MRSKGSTAGQLATRANGDHFSELGHLFAEVLERARKIQGEPDHRPAYQPVVITGDAIYHGLAGHLLLGKGLHILRTRIIAPMEFRIAQVQERMSLKRKEAVEYIETIDADRRKWTRFLYGVDWADASLYDLVLNLEIPHLHSITGTPSTSATMGCGISSAITSPTCMPSS